MIPLRLRITGFLSYREPVEIDFTTFDLACISGQNGAGKSSLLDAITWALFGQARRRDEALINLQSKTAEVAFTFQYEDSIYRVQRALPRSKNAILEFQVLESVGAFARHNGSRVRLPENPTWYPLTERTLRETQACIESTLRLDYETFVNASFFLQGKADQFTQQTAGKRKDVLGSILGLEIWEEYKGRTAERRKGFENESEVLSRRIAEIDLELAEDGPRKQRLAELEAQLEQLSAAVSTQRVALESIRRTADSLEQQRRLVDMLGTTLFRQRAQWTALCNRLAERDALRTAQADLIQRAAEIEAAHAAWRQAVIDLQKWDQAASAFLEVDQKRTPLLQKIASERARLEEEQRNLILQEQSIQGQEASMATLEGQIATAKEALAEVEARVSQRTALEAQREDSRYTHATLTKENEHLKEEMDELKERLDALKSASGATCPLCGQKLSEAHRTKTLSELETEGKDKAKRFRANKEQIARAVAAQKKLDASLAFLTSAETDRLKRSSALAQLTERHETLQKAAAEWRSKGSKRLQVLENVLQTEKFALENRKALAKLDKHLESLGYDAATHDAARQSELVLRPADEEYRKLESARAVVAPLESEIANLKSEIATQEIEIAKQDAEYQVAKNALEIAEQSAPDLDEAERNFLDLSEQENMLHQEVGAARQKVNVLGELRERKAAYESEREALAMQISHHRALERAFGKDGVPALLIEQALPEIESRANEILDRLSDGKMSVRFITQAEYKDKKREDLRETLDIQISDGAGLRDYEMYSGGEAFRVDFAIRLALSEVLAQRKGARLQTLVIDEGFGSQDVQGRQRLIEAINLVKSDFAKILVITHLDELKDAFPNRIEVEKTLEGSTATVI